MVQEGKGRAGVGAPSRSRLDAAEDVALVWLLGLKPGHGPLATLLNMWEALQLSGTAGGAGGVRF